MSLRPFIIEPRDGVEGSENVERDSHEPVVHPDFAHSLFPRVPVTLHHPPIVGYGFPQLLDHYPGPVSAIGPAQPFIASC